MTVGSGISPDLLTLPGHYGKHIDRTSARGLVVAVSKPKHNDITAGGELRPAPRTSWSKNCTWLWAISCQQGIYHDSKFAAGGPCEYRCL